jgi:hypothetical protein
MKNCIVWMVLGCLVVLAATAVLPRFGVQLSGGPLFAVLMVLCCMGPMLLAGRSSKRGPGCCDKEEERDRSGDKDESSKAGGTCH